LNQEDAAAMLQTAKEQLANAQEDFFRVTHNIEAVIHNAEKSIALLMGGAAE